MLSNRGPQKQKQNTQHRVFLVILVFCAVCFVFVCWGSVLLVILVFCVVCFVFVCWGFVLLIILVFRVVCFVFVCGCQADGRGSVKHFFA
jgi:uncharacterized membrane protein